MKSAGNPPAEKCRPFDTLYVQGYTAALMDVIKTFDLIQYDLKSHKRRQNYRTYREIVTCMLENRAMLRETADSFIRCNDKVAGGFELWRECWNKRKEQNGTKREDEHTDVSR